MSDLEATLRGLGACEEAVRWARGREAGREAWLDCRRADWLLWAAANAGVDRRVLVWAACACARTALFLPGGEGRPRRCVEVAERWARGAATIAEVRAAYAGADTVAEVLASLDEVGCYAANAAACAGELVFVGGPYCMAGEVGHDAAHYAAMARSDGVRDEEESYLGALWAMSRIVRLHVPWEAVEQALGRPGSADVVGEGGAP